MFISSKRQFFTIMFKFSEMVSFVYSFRAGLASRTDEIKGAYEGAHNQEGTTLTLSLCHGVFTSRAIFKLKGSMSKEPMLLHWWENEKRKKITLTKG